MRARARRTDPATSHEAAADVSTRLTPNQSAVLIVLRHLGPRTDQELVESYAGLLETEMWQKRLPRQSASGIRTRRHELYERGLVEEHGFRVIGTRRHTIWRGLFSQEIAANQGTVRQVIEEVQEAERRRRTEGTLFDPGEPKQDDYS